MGAGQEHIEDFSPRLPSWLRRPSPALRYAAQCRVYALASAIRLTLPDALDDDWLFSSVIHWSGVLLLAANGCLAGWVLCAVGALLPLLWFQDQLTQSTFLLACALAAIACYAGSAERRAERMAVGLPAVVRWLTLLVYALAAVHKLNRDFFDPAVSCATGGLGLLQEGLVARGFAPLPAGFGGSVLPGVYIAVELGLVALLLWRPSGGVVFAAWMHLPLTIIFAPSFVFTMMSGWVCFLSERELTALGLTLRRRPLWVAAGLLPAAVSRFLFFPGRCASDPDWCVKEALLWLVAAWLFVAWMRGGAFRGRGVWLEPSPVRGRAVVFAAAFALHGLTPYLGVQFHHTGAMLSNLRIDRGCHNSLVFPEALRVHDPYVYLDEVGFAPHRASPELRASVVERLWSVEALWRERARWCEVHREPLPVAGRHAGRPFAVADFCAADGWPLPAPVLPGMRRFQVNLTRSCPQACVH